MGQDVLVIYSLRFIYFDKLLILALVILADMLGISFGILIQPGLWEIEGSEHSWGSDTTRSNGPISDGLTC